MLPLFIAIIAGTLDLGRAFMAQVQITNAAYEGARYARANKTDSTGTTSRIQQEFQSRGLAGAATVESTLTGQPCGVPGESRLCVSIVCYAALDSTTTVTCASASASMSDATPDAIEVSIVYTFKPIITEIGGLPVSFPLRAKVRHVLSPA
ncbi:MAG: pilus assembly protein [Chloroflexi bacterium]|nr:pilus assembly protein [Chloroflexota bacterium]